MYIVCSDLEGVFVPEVWINVAERTGIKELRLTTRDITDYNVLMKQRLKILAEHSLKLTDIQNVIATIKPLEGAMEFINWVKEVSQLIVVSDTFAQFADPLMKQLQRPTLLCHELVIDEEDNIIDYTLRQEDPKRKVVEALQSLKYKVIAFGDSMVDVGMIKKAGLGVAFNASKKVQKYADVVTDNFRTILDYI